MGRTGRWFAYQNYGIQPDLVTVAKPIAGGLPLGALLATEKVSECIHPGMHGTTFGGGPLACAVALQLIAVLEKEKMLKHVQQGRRLLHGATAKAAEETPLPLLKCADRG